MKVIAKIIQEGLSPEVVMQERQVRRSRVHTNAINDTTIGVSISTITCQISSQKMPDYLALALLSLGTKPGLCPYQ